MCVYIYIVYRLRERERENFLAQFPGIAGQECAKVTFTNTVEQGVEGLSLEAVKHLERKQASPAALSFHP